MARVEVPVAHPVDEVEGALASLDRMVEAAPRGPVSLGHEEAHQRAEPVGADLLAQLGQSEAAGLVFGDDLHRNERAKKAAKGIFVRVGIGGELAGGPWLGGEELGDPEL